LRRFGAVAAPMGPRGVTQAFSAASDADVAAGAAGTIVYARAQGPNVIDVDGNRYVDLAAGFGSLLLGHRDSVVCSAVEQQSALLLQSLGDMHPSDVKIRLLERLAARFGQGEARVLLGQSGADAVSAALKTAVLHTGKPGVIAFSGAYHGLSYGPLALCGLRESYRAPFVAQLNPAVRFVEYPTDTASLERSLSALRSELDRGDVGAVVFEPILGRGGCLVPPLGFGHELTRLCRARECLLVADEIWTGLGRSGEWLFSRTLGAEPDLICLGKGLGGGLPISACVGPDSIMAAWSRPEEVVHTSTFAGAPLACAAALATLDALERRQLVPRALRVGLALRGQLMQLGSVPLRPSGRAAPLVIRGNGLMLGVELGATPGLALRVQRELLARGYIVSLGGGKRESVVLTPPLDIEERLLDGFVSALGAVLGSVST
jgi:4-aminobutyrate aminotransferase / (S)-3-amino-2-methylpropionate transaminase / 5-aminovalerate transaminase